MISAIDGKVLKACIKRNVLVGVAADTNMAITGIKSAEDQIIRAIARRPARYASVKTTIVQGANVTTNIAVTGIVTADKLLKVIAWKTSAAGAPIDVTAECSITSTGNIQLASTDCTNYYLEVEWLDVSVQASDELDMTAECAITSDGNVQMADTALTGYLVEVEWWDESVAKTGVDE